MNTINRRRHERFSVLPMYTGVVVRLLDDGVEHRGHAYDISEGGLRFELDRPVAPGSAVAIEVMLPGAGGRGVTLQGNVIWTLEDPDEPGPVRMAAAITRFLRAGDQERWLRQLSSGRYARAA